MVIAVNEFKVCTSLLPAVHAYWWSLHTDLQQQQAAAQKTAAQGRSGGLDHGYQHSCKDQ